VCRRVLRGTYGLTNPARIQQQVIVWHARYSHGMGLPHDHLARPCLVAPASPREWLPRPLAVPVIFNPFNGHRQCQNVRIVCGKVSGNTAVLGSDGLGTFSHFSAQFSSIAQTQTICAHGGLVNGEYDRNDFILLGNCIDEYQSKLEVVTNQLWDSVINFVATISGSDEYAGMSGPKGGEGTPGATPSSPPKWTPPAPSQPSGFSLLGDRSIQSGTVTSIYSSASGTHAIEDV
jgi:hypothetical protein